jgi:hypothetical protein
MKHTTAILLSILFVTIGAACSPGGSQNAAKPGPRSWIDAPLPGSNLTPGQVEVTSHSTDPAHIAQVELSVTGGVVRTDPSSDSTATLVTTKQQWMPPGPGNYTLRVRARNSSGTWGDYAEAVVTIGGGGIVQGMVYSDLNGNGLPNDAGDAPLDGVAVTLGGCASQTATTAGDGAFHFTGLPAGTCLVAVSKPGWKFSGTYPAGIGYPAQAASDPTKPTAFSIYMTPLATPVGVAQPSPTPTPAAMPSLTPTPTPAAATPIPTATALPPVGIAFYADQSNLVAGQCTLIHWQVTNASQIALDNASVSASGTKQDCPTQTTTHSLSVVTLDNQTVQRSLTITVVSPTFTWTPVPTFTPTPVPTWTMTPPPVGCTGKPVISSFSASTTTVRIGGKVTLSWGPVTNADTVVIDPGIGGVGTPGSTVVIVGKTTTYTLSASCGRNKASKSVTVSVFIPMPG